VYDHTSVLKLIEKRRKLPPLAVRDANPEPRHRAGLEQSRAPRGVCRCTDSGRRGVSGRWSLTMSSIASAGWAASHDEDEWGGCTISRGRADGRVVARAGRPTPRAGRMSHRICVRRALSA